MAMIKFVAPSLPLPPSNYDQMHQSDLIRILRLYFNQLDSTTPLQADYFKGRGDQLLNPHISTSDSTDQYATGNNVATLVQWNTLESASGFTLSTGYATPIYPGVYKIDYSLQFVNTDNVFHDVFVWLEVNGGTQVANSSSRFTIPARKSATDFGYLVGYSSITFEIQAGDEIRLYWATSHAYNPVGPVNGVYIDHLPAQTVPYARPANPSAVGSITFVSALS
jgi:hypothetical protein